MQRRNTLPILLGALLLLACSGCRVLGYHSQAEVEEPPVRTTPSGVEVQDLRVGSGEPVLPKARVRFHFVGRTAGGPVFDTSHDRGRPEEVVLGTGAVVPGLEEGLLGMHQGGLRRLRVPPHLGYGEQGLEGLIPPGAVLVLEVELVEVRNP